MLCIISFCVNEIEDSAQLNALHSTESIKDFSVANLRFRVEKENNVLCFDLYQLIILPLLKWFYL